MKSLFSSILLLFSLNVICQNVQADFEVNQTHGCIPHSVQFTNKSSGATNYLWKFGDGSTSTAVNPAKIYLNKNLYDITLIAFDNNGQRDTLIQEDLISVRDTPQVSFSYQIIDSCANNNLVHFQERSTGGQLFIWDFGDGHQSTQANPTHVYQQAGSYTVSLMVTDTLGCSRMHTSQNCILIHPKADASFASPKPVQCEASDSIKLYSLGQNLQSWQWDFGNGNSASIGNPSLQYQDTGSYQVRLIVQNQMACKDTAFQTLKFKEKSRITTSLFDSVACAPMQLRASATPISNQINYRWFLDSTEIGQQAQLNTNISQSGSSKLLLVSQQYQYCTDTIEVHPSIQIHQAADASFTYDSLNHCAGGTLNFSSLFQGQNYTWDFGDGTNSNAQNPNHTYQDTGIYPVKLILQNAMHCSDTVQRNLLIKNYEAELAADPKEGCTPLNIQFSDSSSQSSFWKWIFDDGDTSYLQNPQHTYSNSGAYYPYLVSQTQNGCSDTSYIANGISVSSDTIDLNGDTIKSCSPSPLSLSNIKLGQNNWLWHFGNGDTSHAQNPTYVYNSSGTYSLTLQTENHMGCPTIYENILTYEIEEIQLNPKLVYFDCSQKIVAFADSTPNAVSWLWNFGDGNSSNLQSPGHRYNDSGSYNISLTVVTAGGCVESVFYPHLVDFSKCKISSAVIVDTSNASSSGVVANIPHNNTGNGPSNCAPQLVQFSAESDSALSYLWDFGDGQASTAENPLHIYYNRGIYNVKLIERHLNRTDTFDYPQLIEVNSPKTAINSLLEPDCEETNVKLFNEFTNSEHYWFYGGQDSLTYDTLNLMLPHGHAFYTVVYKGFDSTGCSSTSVSAFNLPEKRYNIYHQDSSCVGDSLSFMANLQDARYVWHWGDGQIDTTDDRNFHRYQNPGWYTPFVEALDTLGCIDTIQLDSIKIKGARANFTTHVHQLCEAEELSAVADHQQADQYNWYLNDSLVAHGAQLHYNINKSGDYQLKLSITKDNCSHTQFDSTRVTVKPFERSFVVDQLNACLPIQYSLKDTASVRAYSIWLIDGQSYQNDSMVISRADTHSFRVKLIAQNLNGCQDTLSQLINPQLLSANFSVNDTVSCAPFDARFNLLNTTVDSVIWNFGDGHSSKAMQPNHRYLQAGIYTVKAKVYSAGGCVDSLSLTNLIRVNEVKAAFGESFTPTCAPMMVHFQNLSSNAVSYHWDFGDGSQSQLESPTHTYLNSGYFSPQLIVSSAEGCLDTLRKETQIQVPGPLVKFGVDDPLLCDQKSVQFHDSTQNAVSWLWDFGDGNSSTSRNPQHTYQDTGSYVVRLMATDASGCSGFYQMNDTLKIDYKPNAEFNLPSTVSCSPFNPQIQNTSNGAVRYGWYLNDSTYLSDSIPQSITDSGSHQLSLIAFSRLGCSDTTRQAIRINHTPNPEIQAPESICFNESPISLSAANSGGKWFATGIRDENSNLYRAPSNQRMTDSIIYRFDGNCPASDTAILHIKPSPAIKISVGPQEACSTLNTQLQALDTSGINPANLNYQWYTNENPLSQQANFHYTFNAGYYDISLKVSSNDGCSDSLMHQKLIRVHDTVPYRVNVLNVDVMGHNQLMVNWDTITDLGFDQLKIFRKRSDSEEYIELAQINNKNSTFYLDQSVETDRYGYCYKVIAADKCNLQYSLEQVETHCSIKLNKQKINQNTVNVFWTPYRGSNVLRYKLFRYDLEEKELIELADLDWQTRFYQDSTAYCAHEYQYQVKAILDTQINLSSQSNIIQEHLEGIFQGKSVNILRSTIKNNEFIALDWEAYQGNIPQFIGYKIYRKSPTVNEFQLIDQVPHTHLNYVDEEVLVDSEKYTYKIGLASQCFIDGSPDQSTSPILLKAIPYSDRSGRLEWSKYHLNNKEVDYYEIQKKDKYGRWIRVKTVPATSTTSEIDF